MQPFRSACFFSTDNGATVRRRANAAEELSFPLPVNVTNLLRLDETQANNAALLAAWVVDSTKFAMSGSTLNYNGSPAGIDPPGLVFAALANAASLFTKLTTTTDPLTREEQAQLGAIAFRAAGLL
jgi:hypothetical protein